jgi:nucleoside phosphorylase
MPCAVILTALPVEYIAVRAHLTDLREEAHPQGTVYERGRFAANGQMWDVGIVEIGAGNIRGAIEAEQAIAYFKPDVILFVGVAGGIKDVEIGDVVASTKIYGYESGNAEQRFKPRPEIGLTAYSLEQRAKAEARQGDWLQRLNIMPKKTPREKTPRVFVAPIAAGEKVIASTQLEVLRFLRENYGDAIAVEMEELGFLKAARANMRASAMVIRGISELIDTNLPTMTGDQKTAARHASAFAFEVLAKFQSNLKSSHQENSRGALKKILILPANPSNMGRLRLDEELREIRESLRLSRNRQQPEIISYWVLRPRDLQRTLLDHEPQIIQFSGGAEGLR